MRCIEMINSISCLSFLRWLTLTWDVLKCYNVLDDIQNPLGLTLTWDVLK